MIAHRLRPIGWVAGVAGAALSLYLVSLQVAAERAKLEATEMRIASVQREIKRLETEFTARASLRQLESYNVDVLALAAPKAQQYVANEVQLASYAADVPGAIGGATALASMDVRATAPNRPVLRPAVVADVKGENAPVIPAMRRAPGLQTVAFMTDVKINGAPAGPARAIARPKLASPEKVALLDSGALGELARQAAKEAKARQR